MGNIPISVILESAKKETAAAVEGVKQKYSLRPCIMDVIVSSVLADVRNEAKEELIAAANEMIDEKNGELEKAKAAAKKVLKDGDGQVPESDTGQQEEHAEG